MQIEGKDEQKIYMRVSKNEETPSLSGEVSPESEYSTTSTHAEDVSHNLSETAVLPEDHELLESIEYKETELSVTESQYQAITHPATINSILRIRAGPGSGKTFTLIARIAHMLANGTKPEEILVLSMANRSVDSLKETLSNSIGPEKAAAVEISTFHSFAAGLLESYGTILDSSYTKQNIFDESTWKTLIGFFSGKSVKFGPHAIEGSITPARLNKAVSNIMSGTQTTHEVAAEHKISADYLVKLVTHLKESGLIRYDELIADATRLMHYSAASLRRPEISDENRKKKSMPRLANVTAVFVDEFQDVYPSLSRVVRAIVEYPTRSFPGLNKHLTLTGDPNQSIYEFLGVSEKDMMKFHEKLPGMEVTDHLLKESFRCTQPVLDCAVQTALKDPYLRLESTKIDFYNQTPVLIHARSAIEENHKVADEIVRLLCLSGGLIKMKDIAILTKTNEAAIAVKSTLKTKYGLNSHKLSSGNPWVTSRLHILKQILGVIAGDTSSSVSLMSILLTLDSEPSGRKRVSKLFSESINQRAPSDTLFLESYLFDELSHTAPKKTGVSAVYKKYPAVLERMAQFLNQVQHERQILHETHSRNPLEYGPQALVSCLQRMASLDGISQFLNDENNETSKATPLEVLESFNSSVHHAFGKYTSKHELSQTSFLDYFLQTYDSEVLNSVGDAVRVSTIHSAKGLEFPVVFVLGQTLYSGLWDKILRDDVAGNRNGNPGQAPSHERALLKLGNSESGSNTETAENIEHKEKEGNVENSTPSAMSVHGMPPQGPAPTSVSRLLYVALTRARGLVYVGCRSAFSELSATSQTLFSTALPNLQPSIKEGNLSIHQPVGEDGITCGTNEQNIASAKEGESEQIADLARPTISGSPAPAAGALAFPFLHSYAKDVMRPMPAQHQLERGLIMYERIMRKANAERPSVHAPKRPHPKKSDFFVGRKGAHVQLSGVSQSAKKTWVLTKSALHKRSA